jgi:hypothetical protein
MLYVLYLYKFIFELYSVRGGPQARSRKMCALALAREHRSRAAGNTNFIIEVKNVSFHRHRYKSFFSLKLSQKKQMK